MKRIQFWLIVLLWSASTQVSAQKTITYGLGYFGETLTHPGVVAFAETEKKISNHWVIPFKADLGFYHHKRSHTALFADLTMGIRHRSESPIYYGAGIGIGGMASWYNSDKGVYRVDDNLNIEKAGNYAGLDLMPSVYLELGYQIQSNEKYASHIWLAPKVFWQYPSNEKAMMHYAIQVGYSITLIKAD